MFTVYVIMNRDIVSLLPRMCAMVVIVCPNVTLFNLKLKQHLKLAFVFKHEASSRTQSR